MYVVHHDVQRTRMPRPDLRQRGRANQGPDRGRRAGRPVRIAVPQPPGRRVDPGRAPRGHLAPAQGAPDQYPDHGAVPAARHRWPGGQGRRGAGRLPGHVGRADPGAGRAAAVPAAGREPGLGRLLARHGLSVRAGPAGAGPPRARRRPRRRRPLRDRGPGHQPGRRRRHGRRSAAPAASWPGSAPTTSSPPTGRSARSGIAWASRGGPRHPAPGGQHLPAGRPDRPGARPRVQPVPDRESRRAGHLRLDQRHRSLDLHHSALPLPRRR